MGFRLLIIALFTFTLAGPAAAAKPDAPPARDAALTLPAGIGVFVAAPDPARVLDEVSSLFPTAERKRLEKAAGFDPLSVAGWRKAGVDLRKPIAVATLDGEGEVSVLALHAARQTGDLRRFVDALAKVGVLSDPEPARFGDVAGFVAGRRTAVVAIAGRRYILSGRFGSFGESRERGLDFLVQRLRTLTPETSLAEHEPYRRATAGFGGSQLVGFVNPDVISGGLRRGRDDGARAFLSQMRAAGGALRVEDGVVRTRVRVIAAAGSALARSSGGDKRQGRVFQRIPAPVLAGFHAQLAGEAVRDSFLMAIGVRRDGSREYARTQERFREMTGLDLERDVLTPFDGEVGLLLGRLPFGRDEVGLSLWAFVGVTDAKRYAEVLDGVLRGLEKLELLSSVRGEVGGSPLFTVVLGSGEVSCGLAVHDGRVWFSYDAAALRRLIGGEAKPYTADPPSAKLAAVIGEPAPVAAFADIAGIRRQAGVDDRGAASIPGDLTASLTVGATDDVVTLDGRVSYNVPAVRQHLEALARHARWEELAASFGDRGAVGRALELADATADRICACEDTACSQRAMDDYTRQAEGLMKSIQLDDVRPEDMERMQQATDRWMKCQMNLLAE